MTCERCGGEMKEVDRVEIDLSEMWDVTYRCEGCGDKFHKWELINENT